MAVSQKQRAYEALRDMILLGELAPGDRLSDFTLAKKLGISRPPIREAMGRLESESLVEQVPHYGTFVRRLDATELDELFELRELLESHAAGRAAERATPEGLAELEGLLGEMRTLVRRQCDRGAEAQEPAELEALVRCDVAFHLSIIRMSRLTFIPKIVSDFRVLTAICGVNRAPSTERLLRTQARTWGEHTRIFRALLRRDAEAASAAMRRHILNARGKALASLQADRGGATSGGQWPASIRELVARMERYADRSP